MNTKKSRRRNCCINAAFMAFITTAFVMALALPETAPTAQYWPLLLLLLCIPAGAVLAVVDLLDHIEQTVIDANQSTNYTGSIYAPPAYRGGSIGAEK